MDLPGTTTAETAELTVDARGVQLWTRAAQERGPTPQPNRRVRADETRPERGNTPLVGKKTATSTAGG
jgi:hypothetical protein